MISSMFNKIKFGLASLIAGITAFLYIKSKRASVKNRELEKKVDDLKHERGMRIEATERLKQNVYEASKVEKAIVESNLNSGDVLPVKEDSDFVVVNK